MNKAFRIPAAIAFNVTTALLAFVLVKRFCRPPWEEWLGVALLLIPALAHFIYLRAMGLPSKVLISIVGIVLTLTGSLAIALTVFGDAL